MLECSSEGEENFQLRFLKPVFPPHGEKLVTTSPHPCRRPKSASRAIHAARTENTCIDNCCLNG